MAAEISFTTRTVRDLLLGGNVHSASPFLYALLPNVKRHLRFNMGKSDHCCVFNCTNRRGKVGISFHRFPKGPEDRRRAWIRVISRKDSKGRQWKPSHNSRVCGSHFATGKPSSDRNSLDFIPSIFPYKKPKQSRSRTTRASLAAARTTETDEIVPVVGLNQVAAYEEVCTTTSNDDDSFTPTSSSGTRSAEICSYM